LDKQEKQDKLERPSKRPRRKFSDGFKRDAVEIVTSSGKPIAQVARELGSYDATLGNWVLCRRLDNADGLCPRTWCMGDLR
jgi:transposase